MRNPIVRFMLPITMMVAMVMPCKAQTAKASTPTFEAVSIRRNTSGQRGGPFRIDGGRFIATNTNLRILVQYAFNPPNGAPLLYSQLNDYSQLIGLPSWSEDFHFDVQAKVEDQAGPASRDEMRRMLQLMLGDRFQLRAHWERQQQLVYNLIATGASKLKRSEDQTSVKGPDTLRSIFNASGAAVSGKAVTISDLAGMLTSRVNRPVYDKTDLKGLFDFQLTFAVDSTSNGPLSSGPVTSAQPSATTPRGPSLFTAIEEQLGLKLQSAKGPVEVLVIDSVRKPIEN